jgi:hypothetical protein
MGLRRLVRTVTAGAAALVATAGLGLTAAAASGASTNLLPNGSFDSGSISGWGSSNATRSLASPGYNGSAGAIKVTWSGSGSAYSLWASPKSATNVAAGTVLQADGYVSVASGRNICLYLQEHNSSGTVVQTQHACATGTGAWQALPTVTLTDQGTGDSVGYMIRQSGPQAGDSFLADSLTLSDGSSSSPSPTTTTSSPSPTTTTSSPSPSPTASTAGNLLSNGTFDSGSTSGWKSSGGSLAAVTGGQGNTAYAAKVTYNGTATSYQMYTAPRPVTSTTAGEQLVASGYVLGVLNRTVCLQLAERNSANSLVQKVQSCVLATGGWQPTGQATLTAKYSGDSVAVLVHATKPQPGDWFEADTLSLTGGSSTASPSPSPTGSGTAAAIWHMDETSGTVMHDSSGNGNNGTILNSGLKIDQSGYSNYSYFFPGSGGGKGYVDVPGSASLNPGNASVDISFWLHTSSAPSSGDFDLVRNGIYPSEEYKTELLSDGTVSCTFHGSSADGLVQSTVKVNNGTWHHIECTETANSLALYVDGALQQSVTAAVGTVDTSNQDVTLGSHGTYDFYKGKLDEVTLTYGG